MTEITIAEVVLDKSIYPRTQGDAATVQRYAEAMGDGAEFPPIVLETGTKRLIDGWHRLHAAQQLGWTTIQADWHTIPADTDPRLYAASLSAKHGLPIEDGDLEKLARDLYQAEPDVRITEVARMIGRARSTVQRWVQDLAEEKRASEERQRLARRYAVLLLKAAGWTQDQMAEALGTPRGTIVHDAQSGVVNSDLDESALRAALDLIPCDVRPDVEDIAETWREQRIFATWTDDERDLLKKLRDGGTVVVNMRDGMHSSLWEWATAAGLAVRVDRRTEWGNPFITPDDGDRDTVVANYRNQYLPHKPSLLRRTQELVGKALGCWCAPERCHADELADLASVFDSTMGGAP